MHKVILVVNISNLHKLLLDNLKTGVVLLNSELRFLYVNAAAEAQLEISDRKARGLFIGDLFIVLIKRSHTTDHRALKQIHYVFLEAKKCAHY